MKNYSPKKAFALFLLLSAVCPVLYAQVPEPRASAAVPAGAPKQPEQRVFNPSTARDPFLSKEETQSIENARLAAIKQQEDERRRSEELKRARLEEIERQRLLEEELRKNPARQIINKIRVDGIVGREAIINGNFKGVGDTVLGAKITKVGDTSVTFVYKGQTFVKKIPMSTGVGVI